jgi:hypothetical protein
MCPPREAGPPHGRNYGFLHFAAHASESMTEFWAFILTVTGSASTLYLRKCLLLIAVMGHEVIKTKTRFI